MGKRVTPEEQIYDLNS